MRIPCYWWFYAHTEKKGRSQMKMRSYFTLGDLVVLVIGEVAGVTAMFYWKRTDALVVAPMISWALAVLLSANINYVLAAHKRLKETDPHAGSTIPATALADVSRPKLAT